MAEIDPYKRNTYAEQEISLFGDKKEDLICQRTEKILEIDIINSNISSIEAQIANIMMNRRNRNDNRK